MSVSAGRVARTLVTPGIEGHFNRFQELLDAKAGRDLSQRLF